MRTILCLLAVLCLFLQACAYGIYDDKRLLDTMSADKALATGIKTALLENNVSSGFKIAVYSYYRHVFLVGEVPAYRQESVRAIAEKSYPKSLTTHFFTPEKSEDSDFILSGRVRAALIEAKGLSSTRVDTEINAGRVVLLGVVGSEHERKTAIRAVKQVSGVRDVISYLMLPPKPGLEDM